MRGRESFQYSFISAEERAFANCKSAQYLPAQLLLRLWAWFPTSVDNMVQNNLKRSTPIPLNDPAEHSPDGKLPSAMAYLELGNTHEYFIKLLLFKYNKSRQNALLLLTVNGDGTQFCWIALLSCVRQQSHQLQQHLHWVTAVAFNTSRNLMFPPLFPHQPYSTLQCSRLLRHKSVGEGNGTWAFTCPEKLKKYQTSFN